MGYGGTSVGDGELPPSYNEAGSSFQTALRSSTRGHVQREAPAMINGREVRHYSGPSQTQLAHAVAVAREIGVSPRNLKYVPELFNWDFATANDDSGSMDRKDGTTRSGKKTHRYIEAMN